MTRIGRIFRAAGSVSIALAVTSYAYAAGSVNQVLIANIQVATVNGVSASIVNFPGGVGGTPAGCALFPRLGMGVDVTTSFGKSIVSTATAAFLAGKKVSVNGTGACLGGATSNGIEAISSITILP